MINFFTGCYRFGDPLNEEADSLQSDDEDHSTGRGEDDSDEFADDEGMSNQEDSSSQEYLDDSNYLDDEESHQDTYSQFLASQGQARIRPKYPGGNYLVIIENRNFLDKIYNYFLCYIP